MHDEYQRPEIAADVGIARGEMIHSSWEGDDRANELCSSSTISVVTPFAGSSSTLPLPGFSQASLGALPADGAAIACGPYSPGHVKLWHAS
jgi:hypothetical protein